MTKNIRKASQTTRKTIHFQPTKEVRELLEAALGPNPDRGVVSKLMNKAIHAQLPELIKEMQEEERQRAEALAKLKEIMRASGSSSSNQEESEEPSEAVKNYAIAAMGGAAAKVKHPKKPEDE